jgi:hypothetical protein
VGAGGVGAGSVGAGGVGGLGDGGRGVGGGTGIDMLESPCRPRPQKFSSSSSNTKSVVSMPSNSRSAKVIPILTSTTSANNIILLK